MGIGVSPGTSGKVPMNSLGHLLLRTFEGPECRKIRRGRYTEVLAGTLNQLQHRTRLCPLTRHINIIYTALTHDGCWNAIIKERTSHELFPFVLFCFVGHDFYDFLGQHEGQQNLLGNRIGGSTVGQQVGQHDLLGKQNRWVTRWVNMICWATESVGQIKLVGQLVGQHMQWGSRSRLGNASRVALSCMRGAVGGGLSCVGQPEQGQPEQVQPEQGQSEQGQSEQKQQPDQGQPECGQPEQERGRREPQQRRRKPERG
jgi:hypothetical protein